MSLDAAALERFDRDWQRLKVAYWSGPVVAAVSGGADSLALLLLMHARLGDECMAATVDHGLRPESRAEAEHVAELCRERGIAHAILRGQLPERADGTANLSTRARALRYELLEYHRRAIGGRCIVTAHHADDQLETMIMRLNRASGIGGLASIRATHDHIARPLLRWRKVELEEVVRRAGVSSIDDPSNRDERFDRARLRKALALVDWIDAGSVAQSADYLAEADEALDWAADRLFAELCTTWEGGAEHRNLFYPVEIQRRLVARCIRHVDPATVCDPATLNRVVSVLSSERTTMIGDVLCLVDWMPLPNEGRLPVWTFRKAPPRRSQ